MVFKQLKSALSKLFTPKKMIIFIVFLLLAYALLSYSNNKSWSNISALDADAPINPAAASAAAGAPPAIGNLPNMPSTAPPVFNQSSNISGAGAGMGSLPPTSSSNNYSAGAAITNPSELLPKNDNSAWSSMNPALQTGGGIQTPDLLQAGSLIGLDTIGQSLRNANYQLRSDPYIPPTSVGPWNNTTIEPDLIRAPFEINPSK